MNSALRSCVALALASATGCAGSLPPSRPKAQQERLRAAHALDRVAFGARPGELDLLERRGVDGWIALQLHPERIDESALQQRLAPFGDLALDQRALVERYPTGNPGRLEASPGQLSVRDLARKASTARLLRDIYAERQLLEVMTDFWLNHFNVYVGKGADRWLIVAFERDAIRAHAMGRFRDLLGATARSPAMLFYLDNWVSAGPSSQRSRRSKGRAGLNENYARELLELHTIGVDAGYTERDVVEVARCFTGWTIAGPAREGTFTFDPRMHEPGDKVVLGRRVAAAGVVEGETVLDLLSRDPRTARRIARKLAERFVADDPPPGLIDRLAHTFRGSDGDVREVLEALFRSPEFWDPAVHRAKLKTPLELVVSAARGAGAEVEDAGPLASALARMGMPLYGMPTPDGWRWTADAWSGPAAIVQRLAFARDLAGNRLPGVRVIPARLLGGEMAAEPGTALDHLERLLLAGEVSRSTHRAIAEALAARGSAAGGARVRGDAELAVALLLQSPEFQLR